MQKYLILFFIFASSSLMANESKKYIKMGNYFEKKNFDFLSSYSYLMALKSSDKISPQVTKKLIRFFNTHGSVIFFDLSQKDLKKLPLDISSYISGRYYFEKGDYSLSANFFQNVTSDNNRYPHSLMFLSSIYGFNKDYSQAIKLSTKCQEASLNLRNKYNKNTLEYIEYDYIHDICEINTARHYYANKNFDKAKDLYTSISLESYALPRSLVESSWTSFQLKEYDVSFGRLFPFQSPFMKSFLYPEGEYIKALVLLRYCHLKEFQGLSESYTANISSLKKNILEVLKSKNRLVKLKNKLVLNKKTENIIWEKYLESKVTTRLMVKRFQHLKDEFSFIMQNKKKLGKNLYKTFSQIISKIKNSYDAYFIYQIKRELLYLYRQIDFYSKELTNQQLNMISLKKKVLYKKETETPKEYIRVKDIKRNYDEHMWDFRDEFWADELASYVPVFSNRCLK